VIGLSGMKIISLNTYGGHVFEPLMKFIKKEGVDTDVFCFQEMFSSKDPKVKKTQNHWRVNLLQEIQKVLPEFEAHFVPTQDDYETEPDYPGQSQLGNAIFYRKNLELIEKGDFFICHSFNNYKLGDWLSLGHNLVFIKLKINNQPVIICSVHGNSQPANKLDSPIRLEQSEHILKFLASQKGEKIVVGDFNLFPQTKSIKMFDEAGFQNLISDYNIKTTRGSMMRQLFPEYEQGKYGFQEFADYVFVSPSIKINNFEVPDVPISDHLPLIVEIKNF